MEHAELSGRAHATETVRTYGEHLHDWFDSLEQSGIEWREADERVIAAYRNRMLENPSAHTGKPYARTTVNARVSTVRSEEHTSELQSLMRISYAVFCLKKKKIITHTTTRKI